MTKNHSRMPVLIVFTGLLRYSAQSLNQDDAETADVIDAYYEMISAGATQAGAILVKFIGDGTLLAFPEDAVDRGVLAVLQLKRSVDELMTSRGWECAFTAKIHFGVVVAGPFGARGAKSFDIIGKEVNAAARISTSGVTLSPEALSRVSPGLRAQLS